ncbi:hypothetical protein POVWA1_007970 [Plasmodium ovale wallikeri]|uniref:Uncharacterized protein n=1 Tax=Plasmodium ovale wallikeri TaxID=864142 RepID=A0A1A8YJU4_PLAOA|nr:hypothetical protein POVWA1_007970 [Plasmodium ovale wallikeri]
MCTQAGMQADRHNIGVVTSNYAVRNMLQEGWREYKYIYTCTYTYTYTQCVCGASYGWLGHTCKRAFFMHACRTGGTGTKTEKLKKCLAKA